MSLRIGYIPRFGSLSVFVVRNLERHNVDPANPVLSLFFDEITNYQVYTPVHFLPAGSHHMYV